MVVALLVAGVIPLLLGLLFELVIVAPLRVPLDQTPLFYPWQVCMTTCPSPPCLMCILNPVYFPLFSFIFPNPRTGLLECSMPKSLLRSPSWAPSGG